MTDTERRGGPAVPTIVKVTPAQVNAAKMKIKRSAATGRLVTSSVVQIANAKRAASNGGSPEPITGQ